RRIDLEQELARGHHLAFLDGEPDDAAADVGADVYLCVRLNLTAGSNRSDQIASLYLLDADFSGLVSALHRAGDADDHDCKCDRTDNCPFGSFLHLSFRLAKGMTHGAF